MPFSLSGTTITQTGTDTDLSGLSGLSPVTVISSGTGETEYNLYVLDAGTNIVWNGACTINALREQLVLLGASQANHHVVNGTLTVDGMIDRGGVADLVPSYAVGINNRAVSPDCCNNAFLNVENNGVMDVRGAGVFMAGCLAINNGGLLRTNLASFTTLKTTSSGQVSRLRFNPGSTLEADGLQSNGMPLDFGGATVQRLDRFTPNPLAYGWVNFAFDNGLIARYRDPKVLNPNQVAFNNWNNTRQLWLNVDRGTDVVAGARIPDGPNVIGKEFTLRVLTSSGVSIPGAKVWSQDADNGLRNSAITFHWWTPAGQPGVVNFDQTFTYLWTTDATGNLIVPDPTGSAGEVVTGIYFGGNGTTEGAPGDLRGRTGVPGEDLFDFNVLAYGSLPGQLTNQSMKGNGVLSLGIALLPDTSVTEPSEASALAYTTQQTPARAYDHLKALLVRDYAGETETTATRNGDTIDFGSRNVTIQSGTGEAVVTPTSVTLRANTFTGNITTTGTVTLMGATVVGIVSDSTGSNGILELT